jgi:pyrimidine operon attenuation protein/uracil phosphoribosyltransferase
MTPPDAEALLKDLIATMRPALTPETALVGIRTGGLWIAERVHAALGLKIPCGAVDVSFYRDDFDQIGLHREVKPTDIPFDVEGRDLVVVDDVLYTGRTIRAAMNVLFDYGRPKSIRLAALVDRGGRELPVAAQFLGGTVTLAAGESLELIRDAGGRLALQLHTPQP